MKRVLIQIHIDAFTAKLYTLNAEAKALFGCSFTSKLDMAAGAYDALPG